MLPANGNVASSTLFQPLRVSMSRMLMPYCNGSRRFSGLRASGPVCRREISRFDDRFREDSDYSCVLYRQ
jgi:hypothetical protein